MSVSQHASVALKSSELWPALGDDTCATPLTPGSWQGARDADRRCLKNLVSGQTFEEFEAGYISVLESLLCCSEKDGMRESTNVAGGSHYPNSQKSREGTQLRSYHLGVYNLNYEKVSMTLVFDASLHAISK